MLAEEQFKNRIQKALQKIKLHSLLATEGIPLAKFYIDRDDKYERDVLDKLVEMEAIKLVEDPLTEFLELRKTASEDPASVYRDRGFDPLKYAKEIDQIFVRLLPKFDELSKKFSQEDVGEDRETKPLPQGWELVEGEAPKIMKNGKTLYEFPNNWSDKYRYFSYIWHNYGRKVSYKEVYEYKTTLKHPKKVTKVNSAIRNEINKLRKSFEAKNLPINIETSKGFTLTLH